MSLNRPKLKRSPSKLTSRAKITLTALSALSFFGGWNLVARLDYNKDSLAKQPSPSPLPTGVTPWPTPTPWPTIAPLAALPAVPTLAPTSTYAQPASPQLEASQAAPPPNPINLVPVPIAPLPTLAPLPTMAPLPAMPVPPPPPLPASGGGGQGQRSGGS